MIGHWQRYKVEADRRRQELYRDIEADRLVRRYPGPASLVVDHWTVELATGAAGTAMGVLLLVSLL